MPTSIVFLKIPSTQKLSVLTLKCCSVVSFVIFEEHKLLLGIFSYIFDLPPYKIVHSDLKWF
jgi:hypothetical protein